MEEFVCFESSSSFQNRPHKSTVPTHISIAFRFESSHLHKIGPGNWTLATENFGDSPIKSDTKLGPQTHFCAFFFLWRCATTQLALQLRQEQSQVVLSPSLNKPYNWFHNRGKW